MAIQQIDVDAINLRRKMALLNDGSTVPITKLFDDDGDDTDDLESAVSFTAGPASNGKWYSGAVADFSPPPSVH